MQCTKNIKEAVQNEQPLFFYHNSNPTNHNLSTPSIQRS